MNNSLNNPQNPYLTLTVIYSIVTVLTCKETDKELFLSPFRAETANTSATIIGVGIHRALEAGALIVVMYLCYTVYM